MNKQINNYKSILQQLSKNHKTKILQQLLFVNKDLAPQGSDEWLNERKYSIGGSEMSTITGDNPYQKIDSLVAIKTGLDHFKGNIATRWGKVFEQITTDISEMLFDTTIKETGSLEGCIPNQRYSPDGLAVIKMICVEYENDEYIESEEYCTVLFEYKSPYSSIPSGIIPKHYMPQVKTGLCSIPITDFAIFINNMFRKCSFQDLDNTVTYDTVFHKRDVGKVIVEAPLALGLILFYQTPKQRQDFYNKYKEVIDEKPKSEFDYSTDSDSDDEPFDFSKLNIKGKPDILSEFLDINVGLYRYIYNLPGYIKDMGKSFYGETSDIFQLFDDGFLSVKYCTPHIFDEYNKNEFLCAQKIEYKSPELCKSIIEYQQIIDSKTINNCSIVSYLPWKLLLSDIIYEPRQSDYVTNHNNKLQSTIDIIKCINSHDDQDKKIELFKQYYPKSKILKNNNLDNTYNMQFMPINI